MSTRQVHPKFRATCEGCGKRQPRAATRWTVDVWMQTHKCAAYFPPTTAPTTRPHDAEETAK